jgi:hypothetical protein
MEYRVLIQGTNCHIPVDGQTRRMGFFIWRCVESVSETEAGLLAVQMIHELLSDRAVNAPDDLVTSHRLALASYTSPTRPVLLAMLESDNNRHAKPEDGFA